MENDDQQLVARLRAGDGAAFKAFFEEYFDRLYRFAMSRTRGDADLSEEAAQRTLCRAVRRLETWRGEAALFTWLAQICRNELADLGEVLRRDAGRTVSLDADDRLRGRIEAEVADPASDPSREPEEQQVAQLLREVLDGLPGRYGEVLEWKYLDDMSVDQIATRLRTSFESAQSTLQRARVSLRGALQARGIDASWIG
jgi:RNA polymerase sigma-70 factor (ECF subfamily)